MDKKTIKYTFIGIALLVISIGGFIVYRKIKKHSTAKNSIKVKFVRE